MEPWFDDRTAVTIERVVYLALGLTGALGGCLRGLGVRKGWKSLFYIIWVPAMAVSVALLVVGIVALCLGQPREVWVSFLRPGVFGTVVVCGLFGVLRRSHIASEMRRMQGKDL